MNETNVCGEHKTKFPLWNQREKPFWTKPHVLLLKKQKNFIQRYTSFKIFFNFLDSFTIHTKIIVAFS